MFRISFPAVIIAFAAEWLADLLIQATLFHVMAGDRIVEDMDVSAMQKVLEDVSASAGFTAAVLVFGTATTFGGGYLAARIARQFPYYHGLAMGLVGIAYILYFWQAGSLWMNLLGVLLNVPVSIWGAHFAKQHMPPPE